MIRLATLLVSALALIVALPACSSLDKADQIRARDEKLPLIVTAADISVRKAGRREFTCTGPFNPGYPDGSIFDGFKFRHAWYNGSIRCVEIVACEVISMDNSSEIFQEVDLPKIFAAGMEAKCMVK